MTVVISSNSIYRNNLEILLNNLNYEIDISDKLLLNILPASIAQRMKNGERLIHEVYENVTVVFADVVGFTTISRCAPPEKIICLLHVLFSMFDEASENCGLEKIKTIGDAYLAVAGIPAQKKDHAVLALSFGREMIEIVEKV